MAISVIRGDSDVSGVNDSAVRLWGSWGGGCVWGLWGLCGSRYRCGRVEHVFDSGGCDLGHIFGRVVGVTNITRFGLDMGVCLGEHMGSDLSRGSERESR